MTSQEIILQKLAEWRPTGERGTLSLFEPSDAWTALVTADRNDELGCLVWEARLERKDEARPGATLGGWADHCTSQAVGLLEPFALIELDTARDEALLRSQKPSVRGESIYYHELLLHGTRWAELRRYQAAHQHTRRQQQAFPITHEALALLLTSLVEAC